MKKIIAMLSMLCFVFTLAGCNTIHGLGQDVSAGGKAISTSAEKVKSDL